MSCAGGCCGCQQSQGGGNSSGIKQPPSRGNGAQSSSQASNATGFFQRTAQAIQAANGGAR